MKKVLSHVISIILIPLFAPTYLFCIIFYYFPQLSSIVAPIDRLIAIMSILLLTTLPPFVFVFILFKLKKISSLTLEGKKERQLPQLFSCFNYLAVSSLMIYKFGINDALTLSVIAVAISLIAITIITRYWKISTHTSGISGLFAITAVLYFKFPCDKFIIPLFIIFCSMIFLSFARLCLKVHTPMQVLFGCLLGGGIGFLLFFFTNIAVY
jgi:hypothetical protein